MSGGQVPTIPADEAGAALAVTRPTLPSAELTDLLDGTVVPLAAIFGLDDQRFRAFALEVARLTRVTEAGRLVVGAYLHRARDQAKRGEWTPFVAELADAMGLKTDTLGKWVLAAERHFGMELAKGANPSRRSPLPGRPKPELGRDPSSPPVSAADASPSSDVAGPEAPATDRPEPDLQGREDPPTPAATTPAMTARDEAKAAARAVGMRLRALADASVTGDPGGDGLASSSGPRPQPSAPETVAEVEAHAAALRATPPVLLARWALEVRPSASTTRRMVDDALTDSAGKAEGQLVASVRRAVAETREAMAEATRAAMSPATSGCAHPRAKREPVGGYAVRCKDCSTVKATGALLDADGAR